MAFSAESALSSLPQAERKSRRLRELYLQTERVCTARDAGGRTDALERLVRLLVQPDARLPPPETDPEAPKELRRFAHLVALLERSPEARRSLGDTLTALVAESEGLPLLAEAGLPNDRGLVQETTQRLLRRVLPAPRNDRDLGRLLTRLFPRARELAWLEALPPDLVQRFAEALRPEGAQRTEQPTAARFESGVQVPGDDGPFGPLVTASADALALLAARIQALGLSPELRARGSGGALRTSPFFQLPRAADLFLAQLDTPAPRVAAERTLRAAAQGCRSETRVVFDRLEATGVSLDVVYTLEVVERSIERALRLIDVLCAAPGPERAIAAHRLVALLARARLSDRSLRELARWNLRLLARKIIERAGATGEHYITSGRREYFAMIGSAAGGGVLTAGTATFKLMIATLALAPFAEGFVSGVNYALSFILIQMLGFTLATKQPSMTAAALAGVLRAQAGPSRIEALVTQSARICRSQLAAAFGNILTVSLAVFALDAFWRWRAGVSFLGEEKAAAVIASFHPLEEKTAFYAFQTGIILWLSSIAGGWVENFSVYHRLPQAIAEHRLGRFIGARTMASLSRVFARNVSGWGGSVALGFMLGMTPVFGKFLGLPLDVRHVTLSTGQLAFAGLARGASVLQDPLFLWACGGIGVIFFLNLATSFALALAVALRAREVPMADRFKLGSALLRRFLRHPGEFFFPPKREAAAPHGEAAKLAH